MDLNVSETVKHLAALAGRVAPNDGSVLLRMLDAGTGKNRRQVEPRIAIVEHDDGFPAGPKHSIDLVDRLLGVDRVVKHTV